MSTRSLLCASPVHIRILDEAMHGRTLTTEECIQLLLDKCNITEYLSSCIVREYFSIAR
jgi:hypothetical protein